MRRIAERFYDMLKTCGKLSKSLQTHSVMRVTAGITRGGVTHTCHYARFYGCKLLQTNVVTGDTGCRHQSSPGRVTGVTPLKGGVTPLSPYPAQGSQMGERWGLGVGRGGLVMHV